MDLSRHCTEFLVFTEMIFIFASVKNERPDAQNGIVSNKLF